MYNIQENVRIVIAALKLYNIRHIVVSPGGTNIPISQAVQDDPFFKCYSVADERSAMYVAIGIYLQTGETIATSCTSAQATRNYVPGLTEAYYKHVPILAITTSKLERYSYQEYMQAPDQISLPRDAVKQSFDLPPVTDENTKYQCEQQTKKAILELYHHGAGPIQLNIRITDNLNNQFTEAKLPNIRITKRYLAWESWSDVDIRNKAILIVIGEHVPFTAEETDIIDSFCEGCNAFVYTNHLSNFHGKFSLNANLLISCISSSKINSDCSPDIIITIGGQTGDYSLFGRLVNSFSEAEHWRVSEDGDYVDTYNKLAKIFECHFSVFFKKLLLEPCSSHSYYHVWNEAKKSLKTDVAIPFSNIYAAQQLAPLIPQGSIMNFSILNSLRAWCYFDLHKTITCFSNVAAFGIDGCTSTLIGESFNTEDLCFSITGDLAFFYDMNALGLRHIRNNVRILLINNGGGAEFEIMTRNWEKKIDVKPYISAMGHNGNAKGWAENCGFQYLSASTKEEFEKQKLLFVSNCESPILFEIFTLPKSEISAMEIIESVNKEYTTNDKLKMIVKKVVGEKVVKKLKQGLK